MRDFGNTIDNIIDDDHGNNWSAALSIWSGSRKKTRKQNITQGAVSVFMLRAW